MKNLSIAVIFMSALATSAFAADDQNTQSVTLYEKVQLSGLNSHVTELSKEIAEFLHKQNAPTEDHSGDYYFGGIRNLASSALRWTGDKCRSNAASSQLGALATDHIKSYVLAQQGGSSSTLANYAASWDSASVWKVAGATFRTTGYWVGAKTEAELALEEGALYRIIFDFCQKKHIEAKSSNVLPLAAAALMLCGNQINGGFDQVITEYSRLVHKFSERASLEPLSNAVVAIDYLVEGICHYEVLDVALRGEKKPLERLKNHIISWDIDPYTMLSCTACVNQEVVMQGIKEEQAKGMTMGQIESEIKKFREEKMEEFIKSLFVRYANKLIQNPNFLNSMTQFKSSLENKNQKAIQQSS